MDMERSEFEILEPDAAPDSKRWLLGLTGATLSIALVNDAETYASDLIVERTGTRVTRIVYKGREIYGADQMNAVNGERHVVFAATEAEARDYLGTMGIPEHAATIPRNVGAVQGLLKRNCSLHFVGKWMKDPEVYEAYLDLMRRPE